MSTVVNKVTLQEKYSADPAEYHSAEWLIDPTIPNAPKRYWVVEGDDLREATEGEKVPIDIEYLAQQKEQRIQELREQYNEALELRYETRTLLYASYLLTKAMATMDEDVVDYLSELAQWIEDGDVLVETAESIVSASQTVEDVQSVTLTLTSWLEADPKISTRVARNM